MTVFVSAGHNPLQVGAVFNDTKLGVVHTEYAHTSKYANALMSELAKLKIPAVLVPTGSLSNKIAFINKNAKPGDIAIEIHFNSSPSGKGEGCETLYCPKSVRGEALAKKIQNAITKALPSIRNRGVKEGWYKMDVPGRVDFPGDKNGDEVPDAFLANTKPVSVILEPYFMNEVEGIILHRELICRAIASALLTK